MAETKYIHIDDLVITKTNARKDHSVDKALVASAGTWWLPAVPTPFRIVLGLTLVVLGFVQASAFGFIKARDDFHLFGVTIPCYAALSSLIGDPGV